MTIFTRDLLAQAFPDNPRLRGQLETLDKLLSAASDTATDASLKADEASALATTLGSQTWQVASVILTAISDLPDDAVGAIEIITAGEITARPINTDSSSLISRGLAINMLGKGATSARPSPPSDIAGVYLDTTLAPDGEPVFWTGTGWVDAGGGGGSGSGFVTPMDYGASGDGVADDITAVTSALTFAFANGLPVDGGDKEYGVGGDIAFSALTRPYIKRLRLKQLNPANGRKTLSLTSCDGVQIDSLTIDVGGLTTQGDMDHTNGLLVQGGSGHKISNVDVTGNGMLTFVMFSQCSNSLFENIQVHDCQFFSGGDVDPSDSRLIVADDRVQGIGMFDCYDCTLAYPKVRNLTGNATSYTQSGYNPASPTTSTVAAFPYHQTRGIAGGGNVRCTVIDPRIRNVGQGMDWSGNGSNWGNRQCTISGGMISDTAIHAIKMVNAPYGNRVIGVTGYNNGAVGFIFGGHALPDYVGIDNTFQNCVSINPGYNDIQWDTNAEPDARTGFYVYEDGTGALTQTMITGCRALDRQGFYLFGDDPYDPGNPTAPHWPKAGDTSGATAETWTGYTGSFSATFTTSAGTETKTVTLTNGSTAISWTGALSGDVTAPFVSRPAQMAYGFLGETSGTTNYLSTTCQSIGYTIAASKGLTSW